MGRKLRDHLVRLSSERRARVERQRGEIVEEIEGLAELRSRLGCPQRALAEQLGMSQPAVSKMEHQTDMTLSALRDYVEALGGTVDIVIQLPDRPPVRLHAISDLDDVEAEPADVS